MNNQTSEYLDRRDAPSGRDQNHNGRSKCFDIVPAKDRDTEIILGARMAVLTNRNLTDGARALFTLLLDLALDPRSWHRRRGQVCISNTQLRERLFRSARAIYGWTKELEEERCIWVSKLGRPNMQPMNVFHITDLVPRQDRGPELAGDGMYGNGYRQPHMQIPKGARGGTCTKRHYLFDQYGKPLSAQVPANEAPTRKTCGWPPQNLRGTPAQNDICPPQNLRGTPAKLAGATRTKRHMPPAQNDTTPPQKPAVSIESQVPDQEVQETPLSCLTAEGSVQETPIQQFSGSPALKRKGGENGFLEEMARVLARFNPKQAEEEMVNWGGRWRNRYREDANKAWRVMAELTAMIKENRITRNAGACADDLWRRFA